MWRRVAGREWMIHTELVRLAWTRKRLKKQKVLGFNPE